MKLNDAFPSKYLQAEDFDKPTPLTIKTVGREEFTDTKTGEHNTKVALHFEETEQIMLCNRTNFKIIQSVTAEEDSDNWKGKVITLYNASVEFRGDTVSAIRVQKNN
jgi:hypothetical protein